MTNSPFVASVSMGYGHLRPAYAIAQYMETHVEKIDGPPWTSQLDQTYWHRTRNAYEGISRASQAPLIGGLFRTVLDTMTGIPSLYPRRDLSGTDIGTRYLDKMIGKGFCEEVVTHLKSPDVPYLSFMRQQLRSASVNRERVLCRNRWRYSSYLGSTDPTEQVIQYLAPSRVVERLQAYGVPRAFTCGFSVEMSCGGQNSPLRKDLAHRMATWIPRVFQDQLRQELGESAPLLDRC